jgi:hypothetical protein
LPLWTAATPINGAGQTIAIVGRTDINPNDAPTFWSLFGLGVNGVPIPTLNIIYNGPNPGITGDLGRRILMCSGRVRQRRAPPLILSLPNPRRPTTV